MRAVLAAGLVGFLSTTLDGSAYAQSAKAKPKETQSTGQMICTSSGGCRPVKPGCRLESVRTGNTGITSNVEVCK